MMFCAKCGSSLTGDGTAAVCPRCDTVAMSVAPAARRLTADELAEIRWLLGLVQGRPLRIGERHWEVVDKDGQIVLRVETSDAKRQARFWATAPETIARLLEHLEAVGK